MSHLMHQLFIVSSVAGVELINICFLLNTVLRFSLSVVCSAGQIQKLEGISVEFLYHPGAGRGQTA